MTGSDIISFYGATVATIVAAIQVIEWRRKHRFLTATYVEYFDSDSSMIAAAIANRGVFPTQLDYVAAGHFNRLWRSPWRKEPFSLRSMDEILDRDDWFFGKPIDGKVLTPGEMVHVGMKKADILKLRHSALPIFGFGERPCIWIKHSQSDDPICVKINWHD